MGKTWAVCRRELSGFFSTPIGYVVVGAYAVISGIGFTLSFLFYTEMSASPSGFGYASVPDFEETFLSPFLVYSGTIIMFLGPLITMRLLAEERSKGTDELLFTHPLRDRDIVFGKYAAALGVLLVSMFVLAVHLGIVYYFVPVEPAVLVFGAIAVFLLGASFLSMGLFVSALCRSQITAAVVSFGMFFVFYVIGSVAQDFSEESPVPESWPDGLRPPMEAGYDLIRAIFIELPPGAHAKLMAQGVVLVSDIVYYLVFIAFFLFMTFRAVEHRRWKA